MLPRGRDSPPRNTDLQPVVRESNVPSGKLTFVSAATERPIRRAAAPNSVSEWDCLGRCAIHPSRKPR
jgi:hypothetical protein